MEELDKQMKLQCANCGKIIKSKKREAFTCSICFGTFCNNCSYEKKINLCKNCGEVKDL